jgi:hypothetical protein
MPGSKVVPLTMLEAVYGGISGDVTEGNCLGTDNRRTMMGGELPLGSKVCRKTRRFRIKFLSGVLTACGNEWPP